MRAYRTVALILLACASAPAIAADQLKFGPAPGWAVQRSVPATANAPADAPVAVLLSDQQISFQRGKTAAYAHSALKIQTSQGLAAGNISIAWNPATDTITVHKLHIRRGGQVIDVLAGGQTFTTLRREANLEAAMLDGRLTANIQPEGLQEGDIIELATTIEHSDPIFKGHVEASFAGWNATPYKAARARLIWPSEIMLNFRKSEGLPEARPAIKDGVNMLELAADDVQPVLAPKGAPLRFAIGRIADASSFASWSQVADLMIPLYREASVIPPSGPLRAELERIREATSDPRRRAELALALVQDRVRYVALLMGPGSYSPASAESTWSRRFGDCKGKTALLLGLLRELGIEAEPALVNARAGDALSGRLPMLGLFNHVVVRARIGGTTYWLDGTRTGDASLGEIVVPDFRWALPLVANADLVPVTQPPLARPTVETVVQVDASAGIYAAASFKAERLIRGDDARALQLALASLAPAQLEQTQRDYWKESYDYVTVKSARFAYDKARAELRLSMDGDAKLEWDDGWLFVSDSTLAFDPDFERAAGPNRDAPWAVEFPAYSHARVTIRLPDGFTPEKTRLPPNVREVLAGVEYSRVVALNENVLTLEKTERSLRPEVAYSEALAAKPRLKAIYDQDIYLRVPAAYRPTVKDLDAKSAEKPGSADALVERGAMYLDVGKFDEAIADFTEALKLEPESVWTLANRGVAYAWKRNFEAAEKDFAAAEKIEADNRVVLRGRGFMATLKGDHAAAVDYLSTSLRKEPNNLFAMLNRAVALLAMGKTDEAMRAFDELVAVHPKNEGALTSRAIAHGRMRNFDAAEKDLAAAFALNPQSKGILPARARIAEMRGDFKAVAEISSKVLESDPAERTPGVILQRANALRELGEEDRALADAEQALKATPDSPELRLLRANIFVSRGDKQAAAREADLMARDGSKSDYAQVAAARVYAKLGMHKEAAAAFDRALAISPDAYVYVNRAQSRPRSDIAGKLADLDQALKLEPDNREALAIKAGVLRRKGDHQAALKLYEQAIKASPMGDHVPSGHSIDHLALGHAEMLHHAGRTAEAEKIFAEQRAKATTSGDFNQLCWRKATAGMMLESALADCREALKLKSDNGAILDSLGLVLLRLGRLDEALAAYDQAIAKRSIADSFMGRAIVRARKGDVARANADRAEALSRDADIEGRFAEYGVRLEAEQKVASH